MWRFTPRLASDERQNECSVEREKPAGIGRIEESERRLQNFAREPRVSKFRDEAVSTFCAFRRKTDFCD
jgi:hypothetical protein|tara:strand:- start:7548 stop:7754 length:207 start_codon:yes stop_codon:yes gene_type:complete